MNRPELATALRSIDAQIYPHIEVVLVDAGGKGIDEVFLQPLDRPIRQINLGTPLNRPRAANAALENANGSFLLFLDEDDWIAADHIAGLVRSLSDNPEHKVAYSGAQRADTTGELLDEFISVAFNADLLKRDNFIPIHAALFSSTLISAGCRFDETLDIYEDWDFWLQCSQHGSFSHLNTISAFYRAGGESGTQVTDERIRYCHGHPIAIAREKIFDKWRLIWTGKDINQLLGVMDSSDALKAMHDELTAAHQLVNEGRQELNILRPENDQLLARLEDATRQHEELTADYKQLRFEFQTLNQLHIDLDRAVREILSSFSWRVTAPYRRVRRSLSARIVTPLRRRVETARRHLAEARKPENQVRCGFIEPATENQICSDNFSVLIWAWSPCGLSSIDIRLDHALQIEIPADYVTKAAGIEHPTEDDARQIGFACRINTAGLSSGTHRLLLTATDKNGQTNCAERVFEYSDFRGMYLQLKTQQNLSSRAASANPETGPTVCILLCARGDASALLKTVKSIAAQTCGRWHCNILLANDSLQSDILDLVQEYPDRVSTCLEVGDFVRSVDSDFIGMLEEGEELSENCLQWLLDGTGQSIDLIYSDHDCRQIDGQYQDPWLTPEWSPELLLNQNYIGGFYLLRRSLFRQLAADLIPESRSWRYAILLALKLEAEAVKRVPQLLWSEPQPAGTFLEAELRAARSVVPQEAADIIQTGSSPRKVVWAVSSFPKVSIIIPTTGNPRYLKPCLDTLRQITDYASYEIVILDNSRGRFRDGIAYAAQSGAKVIDCDEDFNWSRLNNRGAEASDGEILLFLNDDIEVISPGWLTEMVRLALLDDVGTVGCLLLYPNGSIQHGGVFLVDHGGGARHMLHRQIPGDGVYKQLDQCSREVSANTGACLMISREKFVQLGLFDEELALVGNDIDLCLRSMKAGYRNIWTPHGKLIHHESVSRRSKPISKDERAMWEKWRPYFLRGDKYYSPAFSPEREDFFPRIQVIAPHSEDLTHLKSAVAPTDTFGVNLIAYIRAAMGVGEAARGNAAALEASGIAFGIMNYEKGNPSRMDNLRWKHKEISNPIYDINLIHINADHIATVMSDLGRDFFKGRYNIGYWAWELPEFPDKWLSAFAHLDEIWVPSTFVNNAIAAKSPIPVITMPHAVRIDTRCLGKQSKQEFGIPENAFTFLCMFDVHSIAQRKNPYGAILAFQQAFHGDDSNVALVIKVNNADQATVSNLIERIGDFKNIFIIERHLDRTEINNLLALIDCYVSLHHAEGFGLGPAEAMSLGKVALLTNWSGNREYMEPQNSIGVDYRLIPLERNFGPYEKGQVWAAPDIDHAASIMQSLVANPELVKRISRNARRTINENFSPEAIGARMKKRLQVIQKSRGRSKSQNTAEGGSV